MDYWSVRLKHPQAAIALKQHHLEDLHNRLQQQFKQKLTQSQIELQRLEQRLKTLSPLHYIENQNNRLNQNKKSLDMLIQLRLQKIKTALTAQVRTLSAVSPLSTLERGYSITTKAKTGDVISDANIVAVGDNITVQLQHGYLNCDVTGIQHD